jgi:hypothetical protein
MLAFRHPEIGAVDINPVVLHEGAALALDALVVVDGGERGARYCWRGAGRRPGSRSTGPKS